MIKKVSVQIVFSLRQFLPLPQCCGRKRVKSIISAGQIFFRLLWKAKEKEMISPVGN